MFQLLESFCWFYLKRILGINLHLTLSSATGLIIPCLDYCSSLHTGFPSPDPDLFSVCSQLSPGDNSNMNQLYAPHLPPNLLLHLIQKTVNSFPYLATPWLPLWPSLLLILFLTYSTPVTLVSLSLLRQARCISAWELFPLLFLIPRMPPSLEGCL